jgi:hypothetical protein
MIKQISYQRKITIVITILFLSSSLAMGVSNQNEIYDISGNQPPDTPDISGPTMGEPGVELNYNIRSTDPENDDIVYCFDWGDDTGEICIGPYPSGEEVTISHTWLENGTYILTVKASDILGEESGIATLRIRIPRNSLHSQIQLKILDLLYQIKKIKKSNVSLLSLIFVEKYF